MSGLARMLFVCLIAGCASQVQAAAPFKTGSYCFKDRTGLHIFADKVTPAGDLVFGFSHWSPEGQNVSVYGVAHRQGDRWVYESGMESTDAADHCRVEITLSRDGGASLRADQIARCQNKGGYGTNIGVAQFPRKVWRGRVKTELDSPDDFQDDGGSQCTPPPPKD